MAAILRVKRKKNDEPSDALLIACKRKKIEDNDSSASTPLTAVVKFAGTVEKQEDSVVEHIAKNHSKENLKVNFKQHIVDISKKAREETKKDSQQNRYKIINSIRSLDSSLVEDSGENIINIIDVEDTKASSDDKDDANYVYDLYYTETEEAIQIENLVSVLPVEEDLVFEDYYKDQEEYQGESEDSNSESNWRNDYPDSEHSDDSIRERDMRNAMKNLDIDDELSSDSSEEFVYGLDERDVERYGYKYAKFKAKALREHNIELDDSISIESCNSDDENEECNDDDCMN